MPLAEPRKVFLEVTDETDVDELTDRLIAALFEAPSTGTRARDAEEPGGIPPSTSP